MVINMDEYINSFDEEIKQKLLIVKQAIKELDGVQKVSARLNTKEVTVVYNEKVKVEDILKAIKTTSYEGVEISTKSNED